MRAFPGEVYLWYCIPYIMWTKQKCLFVTSTHRCSLQLTSFSLLARGHSHCSTRIARSVVPSISFRSDCILPVTGEIQTKTHVIFQVLGYNERNYGVQRMQTWAQISVPFFTMWSWRRHYNPASLLPHSRNGNKDAYLAELSQGRAQNARLFSAEVESILLPELWKVNQKRRNF